MSDDDLITIRKYDSPQEAHLSNNALESADIASFVADDASTAWLWYMGTALGGAKLQVARRDAERALEVLRENESPQTASDATDWVCAQCAAEVDAGFDVCWSCEAERGAALGEHSNDGPRRDEDSEIESAESPADADAMRAWRAALLSILFVPLSLYSLYLTFKNRNERLSPGANWRYYAALAISLGTISLGTVAVYWTVLLQES
jgi:hypothetical protein